ncbi:MAG: DUF6079 family protein [Chloroflexota bacterium]
MVDLKISSLFQTPKRFLRSTNVERDFKDASALDGYILTDQIRASLERLIIGLQPNSTHRAWRITGDYGSGKSTFALLLTHLFSNQTSGLPALLQETVDFESYGIQQPNLLPILVTGSREALGVGLLRSIKLTLTSMSTQATDEKAKHILAQIQAHLQATSAIDQITDEAILSLLDDMMAWVIENQKGTGLLIVIDELGKFLEFATYHPRQQDMYLLQKLAETASRSGKNPLFLIGILHQGFNTYFDLLSPSAIHEWEKVAGRFDELLFNQPLEQTSRLVACALSVQRDRLPQNLIEQTKHIMEKVLEVGWYGASGVNSGFVDIAPDIYPIHPTVLPVLTNFFSRFGQNERSLFSFLFSNEPFGLQEFASRHDISSGDFYRLDHLFDYVRANFGHRLDAQSYRSHWSLIDSLIDGFNTDNKIEQQLIKSIGLLNLMDNQRLLASSDILSVAVTMQGEGDQSQLASSDVVERLLSQHILYYRGHAGGYCLWPYTSVNLEKAYEESERAIPPISRVSTLAQQYLTPRPIVVRRHYVETGNMRYFEIVYAPVDDLPAILQKIDSSLSDGIIIVALCETDDEHRSALLLSSADYLKNRPDVLLAIPSPLYYLASSIREFQRWEWISEKTVELHGDRYASQEVSRQLAAAQLVVEKHLDSVIGLASTGEQTQILWFRQGQSIPLDSRRQLLTYLSTICDELYFEAPHIVNELVNRHGLSSAAAAARMRLLERIFKYPSMPFLGLDSTKAPPEMSMYLSVLKNTNLHQKIDDSFAFAIPGVDPGNVGPTLRQIKFMLEETPNKRVKVSDIFRCLQNRPFGVRTGLIPLLLAVFTAIYKHQITFYEDDRLLVEIDGFGFLRLLKAPETFEMQFFKAGGLDIDLLGQVTALIQPSNQPVTPTTPVDIVRPLLIFAAELPQYTRKTDTLSVQAKAVRSALTNAKEPAALVFNDLPSACGFPAILTLDGETRAEQFNQFIAALKAAIDELRLAYPKLQERMKATLLEVFEVSGSFQQARDVLAERASRILAVIHEPRLKAFCVRLRDTELLESAWLESMGSLICSAPPNKWADANEDMYHQELAQLCQRFQKVESISFKGKDKPVHQTAVHISLTQSDGMEIEKVLYLTPEDEMEAERIEAAVHDLLTQNNHIGPFAASRALWKALSEQKETE